MSARDSRITTRAGLHIPRSTVHGGWQFRSSSKRQIKRPNSSATSNRGLGEPSLSVTLRGGHRGHSAAGGSPLLIGAMGAHFHTRGAQGAESQPTRRIVVRRYRSDHSMIHHGRIELSTGSLMSVSPAPKS